MATINWHKLHPNVQALFRSVHNDGDAEAPVVPILALAPMEDVTILPFRRIIKRYGADLVYTEFIPAAALVRDIKSAIQKLEYEPAERPLSVQIYGSNPAEMARAAKMVEQRVQPDFIDINLGCPVKKIANRGDGAGLLKPDGYDSTQACPVFELPPSRLKATVCAVVDAVSTPVTVKMRLGWDQRTIYVVDSMQWFPEWGVQFIALHGRTKAQAYTGKADWNWIKLAKEASTLPLIGNGDIVDATQCQQLARDSGVDGMMIGRGAIVSPWLFRDAHATLRNQPVQPPPTLRERMQQYIELIESSIPVKGEYKAVIEMRKYLPGFLSGAYQAAQVRKEILKMENLSDVSTRLNQYCIDRESDPQHPFPASEALLEGARFAATLAGS